MRHLFPASVARLWRFGLERPQTFPIPRLIIQPVALSTPTSIAIASIYIPLPDNVRSGRHMYILYCLNDLIWALARSNARLLSGLVVPNGPNYGRQTATPRPAHGGRYWAGGHHRHLLSRLSVGLVTVIRVTVAAIRKIPFGFDDGVYVLAHVCI